MYVNNLSYNPKDPLLPLPGDTNIRWGIQVFTTRNLYALAPDSIKLYEAPNSIRIECHELSWAGQQQRSQGSVKASVCLQDGTYSWSIEAWHHEPVKAIKLLLHNLPEEPLKAGFWHPTSPPGETQKPSRDIPIRWRYPWPEWLTPWACVGEAGKAICISVRDSEVRAKRFYVHRPPYLEYPEVEVICEEDARRWDSYFSTPEIRMRIANGFDEITEDFESHLSFLEKAYGLQRWEIRQDVPKWMHDIKLVVNLHGQHWTGYVFNTFPKMAKALEEITKHIPGRNVLCYIPGWEGRYYFQYPYYSPGEDLGGEREFARLVSKAHQLGVKIMPMFGANGANAQLYERWREAAFLNRTGRVVRLINAPDWDTDRFGEDDQVFLNPGEPMFREHLLQQISQTVEKFEVDGVFLDTSACWFNDPRYNLYEGYKQLVESLRARFPNLLVAGEGWYDALLALFPVNQSWLGIYRGYRFHELLTRYSRALGHLAQGAPGTGSTGVHEGGFYPSVYKQPAFGHIPCITIADDTLEKYSGLVAQICKAALGMAQWPDE